MPNEITEDERDLHETLAAFAPVFVSLLAQAGFFRGQTLTKRFWGQVQRAALAKNTEAWQHVAKLYSIPSFREGQLQTVKDLGIKPTAILPKGEPKAVLKAANPNAKEFFERREKKFIALTTRDDMKRCRALTEAEAKKVYQEVGNNPVMHERKFAQKFENSYICDGDQTRLKRIKRTESHNAATAGAYLQAEHADAKGSWWRTAGDRRVRDAHAAVNGTWAALGHTFANGKIGPVGEINCRCHQEFTFDVPKGYTAKEPIKGAMWNEDNWEQSKWQPPKESTRALFRPKAKPVTAATKVSKAPAEEIPKKAPEVNKPKVAPIEKPINPLKELRAANTSSEVQSWAEKHYPDMHWNLREGDPALMKSVAQRWHSLARDFPVVSKDIKYIGLSDEVGEHTLMAAANMASGNRGIVMNKKFFTDKAKLDESLGLCQKYNYHPDGTNNAEGLLTHEFGHFVDYHLENDPATANAIREWKNIYKADTRLSRYSVQDESEGWAEGFTAMYGGAQKHSYVDAQYEFLQEVGLGV